jgi:hypothetical protein
MQHYFQLLALTNCDLYQGDGAAGFHRVERAWPALQRSMLMRIASVNVEGHHLRARAAIAAATASTDAREARAALAVAERDGVAIERATQTPWTRACAALLRAEIAAARGDADTARLFVDAEARCRDAEMAAHELAARRRRGVLAGAGAGGDEGRALVSEAEAGLAARGVTNPSRMAAMLVP